MIERLADDVAQLRRLFQSRGFGETTVQISEEVGQLILERLQQLEDRADVMENRRVLEVSEPATASALAAAIDGVETGSVFFLNDFRADARTQNMEHHNDI